jgi:predicted AlkP superfamily phosphohydrolase/phosphomutase
MAHKKQKLNRRQFLKESAVVTAALTTGLSAKSAYAGKGKGRAGRKVIVIGIDGMDPGLSQKMMRAGRLPNFARLAEAGGFRTLGTSIPPLSPVAWANFINGAGPGSHGIFDFIHRNPERQVVPFLSTSETVAGYGYWETGDHKLQLDFWPFNHKPAETLLRRQGVPFWDYLDEAGISSTFYNLPANYPPSRSKHGNHRSLAGMGTPDMEGKYGGCQHFAEDGPFRMKDQGGCKMSVLFFENETASGKLVGPPNTFLKKPQSTTVDFLVHRDTRANTAVIEIQGRPILLKKGEWSPWIQLDFELSMPVFLPDKKLSGICRFYLQEVAPNFRLYVTPINTDPSKPALRITEPQGFIEDISDELGLFYTSGMQEDFKSLQYNIFNDDEFVQQSTFVLEERLNLLDYALKDYDDGLLFFYFSSTDLQAHMLWWDSDEKHPTRSARDAKKYFGHLQDIYCTMDSVVGDILKRYGNEATIIVMSDHGFANWKRQFDVNAWLRDNGYLGPDDATSIMLDVDWSQSRAYALGINGLYLNQIGREKYGIVTPGPEREKLLEELVAKLEVFRDVDGSEVVKKAYRTDKAFSGPAMRLAPDIIIGCSRGYRASWGTGLGNVAKEIMSDNDAAWSADHAADPPVVPGVIFSNRPIGATNPSLIDIAPSILTDFGLNVPSSMEGKNIFKV